MNENVPVQTLEECVKKRNLFLIHIGHTWVIVRATGEDSVIDGAIPLPLLNKIFPKAAMINTLSRINDLATLEKYMKAGSLTQEEVLATLNTELPQGGYQSLVGASSMILPPANPGDHQWPPRLR